MRKTTYQKDFNADELQKLYAQMTKKIAGIKGKEVVAFVGMTGSGKSTTVNYLLDKKMERFSDGLSTLYQVKEDNVDNNQKTAEIGHGGSQTLFPESFDTKSGSTSMTLLDTAGLGDTRGKNVSLCVSLALKHISEVAKVKGVVIVLRENMISDTRARGMDEFFKLVTELSSELNHRNVAFCVTGISPTDNFNEEDIKQKILNKVSQNCQIMLDELDEDDSDAIKEKTEQTVRILQLMQPNSLFLLRDLDNQELQTSQREKFFAYCNQMPGLKNGLNLAIPEATESKLEKWSTTLAKSATSQLTELSNLKSQHAALSKQQTMLQHVLETLKNTISILNTNRQEIRVLEETVSKLSDQKDRLTDIQNDLVTQPKKIPVPLPRIGSGITGFISHEKVFHTPPNFEAITPYPGTKVIAQNQREGSFTLKFEQRATETKNHQPKFFGFDISYLRRNLPAYQHQLEHVTQELDRLSSLREALVTQQKTHEKSLSDIKHQISGLSTDFALDIANKKTLDELLAKLDIQYKTFQDQQALLSHSITGLTKDIQSNEKEFNFLYQLAKPAELTKFEDIRQFMKLLESTPFFSRTSNSAPLLASQLTQGLFRNNNMATEGTANHDATNALVNVS